MDKKALIKLGSEKITQKKLNSLKRALRPETPFEWFLSKSAGGPGSGVSKDNTKKIDMPMSEHISIGKRKKQTKGVSSKSDDIPLSKIKKVCQEKYVPKKKKKFVDNWDEWDLDDEPVDILKVSNDEYHVIDGHHKFLAAKELGKDKLKGNVYDKDKIKEASSDDPVEFLRAQVSLKEPKKPKKPKPTSRLENAVAGGAGGLGVGAILGGVSSGSLKGALKGGGVGALAGGTLAGAINPQRNKETLSPQLSARDRFYQDAWGLYDPKTWDDDDYIDAMEQVYKEQNESQRLKNNFQKASR